LAEGNRSGGRAFSTLGRVVLIVLGLLLVWIARDLLLLLFAGILLAVFLRTLATWIAERSRLSQGWSLAVVVLGLLGVITLAGFLFAPSLSDQVRQLADTLPQAASRLEARVRQTTFGGWAMEQWKGSGGAGQQDKVMDQATTAARKVMDGIVAAAIVLFTGLYLAAAPAPYQRGLLRLLPKTRRRRFGEVMFAVGYTLRWWLLGQLLSMTVVGLLMGVGLALIGVPLAFALGVLAGLFEFIPTIGPVIGLLPALLLALAEDPRTALYVLILYGVVQTVESYLLTPMVQERVLELPPVVTIATQVLFGWTLGAVGLLVAVPFVAMTVTIVQMLYVEDTLGDGMHVHAEEHGRRELEAADLLEGIA
jgi:predicted PurR-regulated permease PerM